MVIHVDFYGMDGQRIGPGPVTTAKSVSITRLLDAVGSVNVDFPGTDQRVLSLIAPKRRVRIRFDDGSGITEIGRMIIEKTTSTDSANGFTKSIEGPDSMAELKFRNTRRGRKYTEATVNAIVDDLLTLVPGWSRGGSVTDVTTVRFDSPSVLKALRTLVSRKGVHFRQNPYGIIEIGTFGNASGITVVNRATAPIELEENRDIMLIESLTLVEDSEDIINWIEPIGAGRGDAAITLEKSTRFEPYPILTETGPDGRTVYYLNDVASEGSYGRVEKTGEFKDVVPVGTSEADQVAIANALYDLAVTYLTRYKEPYTSYILNVRNAKQTVQPGDKIRLRDQFRILSDDGSFVDVRDIDADFWVMEVSERIGVDRALRLKVASVDRVALDESEVVVGALESISISNVSVEPFFCGYVMVDFFDVDPSHAANFQILVTERTQSMQICRLRVVTSPFRSNIVGAAAGGGEITTTGTTPHRHTWASVLGTPDGGGGFTTQTFSFSDGTNIWYFNASSNFNPASTTQVFALNENPEHSHSIVLNEHTHNPLYGIFDDTQRPADVTIEVNNVTIASGLGGIGTAIDATYDITEAIQGSPPLQKAHQVRISCAGGRGKVKVFIERWEIIQTVSTF